MAFGSVLNLSTLNGGNGFALNGVNAGDISGFSVSNAGDVNGDGKDDLIIGANFGDPNGRTDSGQAYVVFGSSNGFASSLNLSTLNGSNGFALNGINSYDISGRTVSSAGDVNGDGTDDLIIGGFYADPNGRSKSGQSYVVFGSSNAFVSSLNLSTLNGSNGFALNGVNVNDLSGSSVSSAGDVNGDGTDDLIVGAYGADPNAKSYSGQSYVVFGSSNGFVSSLNLSTLNGSNGFALNGVNAGDRSGISVSSAGDVNGDGTDDLIVGAFNASPNGKINSGQSYVLFGSSNGFASNLNLSTLNGSNGFALNGINAYDNSGYSVSSAGDVNGDGTDDLIIGARNGDPNGKSNSGQSYVVFGSSNGFASSLNLSTLNGSNGFALNGVSADDNSGRSVSSAGDVNGDGTDDLIIGARNGDPNSKSNSGQSYVVFGSSNGFTSSLNLSTLNGSNGFALNGVNADDLSGSSVSSAGDVNGDGRDDLIIGAPNGDPNSKSNSGQSYVVFGQLPPAIIEGDNNDNLLNGSSTKDDTIIGYGGNDTLNGFDGNDSLDGGADNDTLDGGTGNDTLNGGQGFDTYIIDTLNDVIQETITVTTEIDTVETNLTYTLGNNLENLNLTGNSNINGVGNELDNSITGNSEENSLVGGSGNDILDGGNADDTLTGGVGNDIYYVDSSLDVISETSTVTTEIDAVFASDTYLLSANLDNLTLTGNNNIDCIGNNRDNNIQGNSGDNILTGGAGNDTLDGQANTDTLKGGTGNDLYVISDASDVIQETVTITTQIDTVQSSVTYTLSNNLENLTLKDSANLDGVGNSLDNSITGNSGNNALDGLAGNDTLTGGLGNDTYIVDSSADVVSETSTLATEIDTVQSSVTYTLGSNLENLTLTDSGNINGVGNSLDNSITGNSGNNALDGLAGNDTLTGGLGNDTYIVDSSADVVSETSTLATEIDTVQSSVTYTLGSNLENLTLTDSGNINGVGNSLDNSIIGNSGNNALDGLTGNDTLTGGLGNDTYIVDSSADVVSETSTLATEIDTVQSSVTYTLGSNLENLTLTDSGNINGVGNSLDNSITGNSSNNTLDGQTGNDTLTGGLGNDTYIVDSSADVISETSTLATEIDTVQSSVTYTLGNNLDNLTLTGSANLDGVGNSLNNIITGNLGNNSLTGGLGNDTYIVNSSADVISETSTLATEIDTVQSSVTYTLGSNLDNLTLTGSANLDGVGNSLNNNITGNSSNNTLDGQTGNDTLTGGLGNDTYIVDSSADVISETSTLTTEIDNVQSSATYTLSANLENLTMTGSSDIEGVGNDLANTITANSGNNVIRGGLGKDTLIGNVGNDYLGGGDQDDSLVAGLGDDTVYGGFENDSISGGDGNDLLLGAGGKDSIDGDLGNDYIDGGAWYDTMIGGMGNDTYLVDSSSDVINETSTLATEIDEVRNTSDFSLSANLENLILEGSDNIFGQGNSLENIITGNTGDNFLTGGEAADTIIGNDGNDRLKGDAGSDTLIGGNGDDTLIGYGGAGEKDTLVGGSGNDVFFLGDATTIFYDGDNNTGYGLITNFAAGDNIQLKSPSTNYDMVKSLNFVGTTAKDTIIATADGDIIGIVQDNTSLITSLTSNIFIYV